MKIVHLSDTHGFEVPVPDGDVLIHTGDFSRGRGNHKDCIRFEQWMSKLPHATKLMVPGNHDGICEWSTGEARQLMPSVRMLVDEVVEIGGIRIMGSPWSVKFMDWAFMKEEHELGYLYGTWPKVDVIASHGPAYQRLDHLGEQWLCAEMHVGSKALLHAIEQIDARLILCGHIHAGYGQIHVGNRSFYNSAIVNDDYKVVNKPHVIEIGPITPHEAT